MADPKLVKVLFCLRRRPELSREEFLDHSSKVHGPLVVRASAITGVRKYIQNRVMETALGNKAIAIRGNTAPHDPGTEFSHSIGRSLTLLGHQGAEVASPPSP